MFNTYARQVSELEKLCLLESGIDAVDHISTKSLSFEDEVVISSDLASLVVDVARQDGADGVFELDKREHEVVDRRQSESGISV